MESELEALLLKLKEIRKNSALRSYYEEEVLDSIEEIVRLLKKELTPKPEAVCYKTCRCGVKDCKGSEAI